MSDTKETVPVTCELIESARKAVDDARARATHLQRIINVKSERLKELTASNEGHLKAVKELRGIVRGFEKWLNNQGGGNGVTFKDVAEKWVELLKGANYA